MASKNRSKFFSIGANSLTYRLKLSFALFFLAPILGFLWISLRYDLLEKLESHYYVLAILVFSLFGYIIVRQIIEGIERVAKTMTHEMTDRLGEGTSSANELEEIETRFNLMNRRLRQTSQSLERRMAEIEAIRELNNIPFSFVERTTLLDRALERILQVTQAWHHPGTVGAPAESARKYRIRSSESNCDKTPSRCK